MASLAKIVELELNHLAQAKGTEPDTKFRLINFLASIAAIPLAYGLLWTSLLSIPRTKPMNANRIVAVQGEWSNRTKHVLTSDVMDGSVLIVGRPQKSNLFKLLNNSELSKDIHFNFTLDLASVLITTVSSAPRLLRVGLLIANSGFSLSFKETSALVFRVALGQCHAIWWRRSGLKPETVIFGHTGNADCSTLELSMQKAGVKTVHAVHGVGCGWAFAGLSDLAIYSNAHDAASVPAKTYGKAVSLPLSAPKPAVQPAPTVLFTSYTHPMNPVFQRDGIKADQRILEWAASADLPKPIVWRPHPAIKLIDSAQRAALEACATSLGFQKDKGPLDFDSVGQVITTPSTLALDSLRAGKLPILVSIEPVDPKSVYTHFDTVKGTRDLSRISKNILNTDIYRRKFNKVWNAILPSAPLTLDALIQEQEAD